MTPTRPILRGLARRYWPVAGLLLAAGGAWAWHAARATGRAPAAAAEGPRLVAVGGLTMGGTWSAKLPRLPVSVSAAELEAAAGALLDRLEGQMSTWRPESDLSRFNRYHGTDWFPVPRELAEVVAAAGRVSEQTGGAFDVTVGPLVNLWGFGADQAAGRAGVVPSEEAIAGARAHVGYRLLESRLSPPALRKADPAVYADLGGIAKGYAAGAVAEYLDSLGATDYLVAVGGELRARGLSHLGRPWRAGIETPTPDVRRVLRQVELRDASLSTSGDYRNFFDAGGRRYSHEIDPRTGRPAENAPASVSVVHPSAAYADAMATALMVLGPERGYDLAVRLDLSVLIVTRGEGRFDARATPAFERTAPSPDAPTGRVPIR